MELISDYFKRNIWLIILQFNLVIMCAILGDNQMYSIPTTMILYFGVSLLTFILGRFKDTSDRFIYRLPIVIFIGIVPAIFGITLVEGPIANIFIILVGNIYYFLHRKRAYEHEREKDDKNLNVGRKFPPPPPPTTSAKKRQERNSTINNLLDDDLPK